MRQIQWELLEMGLAWLCVTAHPGRDRLSWDCWVWSVAWAQSLSDWSLGKEDQRPQDIMELDYYFPHPRLSHRGWGVNETTFPSQKCRNPCPQAPQHWFHRYPLKDPSKQTGLGVPVIPVLGRNRKRVSGVKVISCIYEV